MAREETHAFLLGSLTSGVPRTEYVARSWLGAIQLALGRLDRAAVELRRAYAEGDWELGWASSDRDGIRFEARSAICRSRSPGRSA
jgi:hypothetical protein